MVFRPALDLETAGISSSFLVTCYVKDVTQREASGDTQNFPVEVGNLVHRAYGTIFPCFFLLTPSKKMQQRDVKSHGLQTSNPFIHDGSIRSLMAFAANCLTNSPKP